jgi:hypothetical protein
MKEQGSAAPLLFHPLNPKKMSVFPDNTVIPHPAVIEPKGAALPWVQ